MSKWYEFKVEDGTRWIDISRIIAFDKLDQGWQGAVLCVEFEGTIYVEEDVAKVQKLVMDYERKTKANLT